MASKLQEPTVDEVMERRLRDYALKEEDVTNLDQGKVVLQWPRELSPESLVDFEYWIAGVLQRARRKAEKYKAMQIEKKADTGAP